MTERLQLRLGMGSCCQAGGAAAVYERLDGLIRRHGLAVDFSRGGCVGMCHRTPLLEVRTPAGERVTYGSLTPDAAEAVLQRYTHFRRGPTALWKRLTSDAAWLDIEAHRVELDSPPVRTFLAPQVHVATEHYGRLDPLDLEAYRAAGGYEALLKCRTMPREKILAELEASNLRGRGGAGFPAARKWRLVAEAPETEDGATGERERDAAGVQKVKKYVVCNGDEGDPGAFMDRMLLESYPHRVLEGLLIAAACVGADEAVFYIRQEYPLATRHVRTAIEQATAAGLCEGVTLRVVGGAGAFVCGEETALLESIEGRRGQPRPRPPYPARRGLHGRPTLVSNVETYSCVPWILRHGGAAFAAIGTPGSTGTKVFALAGKVLRGGLVEAPMGLTIRQLVMEIGGGVKHGRTFKAVQIGGPSGGCIPAALADTPIDFEALAAIGGMMGSGGLVVLDDTDCMVDIAAYFLAFTREESCGQCTACRVGATRMLEILQRIRSGDGRPADLDALEEIARAMQSASLCGLGRTAPNPVLTTLKYFREEYEAHVAGTCPTGRCPALSVVRVTEDCIGCTRCLDACPHGAIAGRRYQRHAIDAALCTRCGMCIEACPVSAIERRGASVDAPTTRDTQDTRTTRDTLASEGQS